MKRVISGKLYDTDTARRIGKWESEALPSDLGYCAETLYRKRTGEYFLHGEGGAATKYARRMEQNAWSGGEIIMPLSADASKEWAETHLSADEYQAAFGEIVEDDTRKLATFSLRTSGIERAKRYAAEHGTTMSALVDGFFAGL